MTQEELKDNITVVHTKYNRKYKVISSNAKLKDSNLNWINCVIYQPLYENEIDMFARENKSFLNEFEVIDENNINQS